MLGKGCARFVEQSPIKPSVRAAYRDQADKVGASLIWLYNKRNGIAPHTSSEAALLGFCLALVAANMLAVVMAAWRSVHGETSDQERSLYDVAHDIAQTSHGMMIAIPEDTWRVFSRMRPAEMVATLQALAQTVRLKAYRKRLRGPKKPRPKRQGTSKASHVSTAKLLRE
jgi:hypothetical protein